MLPKEARGDVQAALVSNPHAAIEEGKVSISLLARRIILLPGRARSWGIGGFQHTDSRIGA